MKQKLFKNVEGNSFRLITESITETVKGADLVREGLKKVFSAGGTQIPYRRLENVGLGYIKDVSEATKIALQESRILAKEYGYVDEEGSQSFIRETPHPEANMANPEEKREVQIGKTILDVIRELDGERDLANFSRGLLEISKLAEELLKMHGGSWRNPSQTPQA